jgi:hypothetical protein
VIPFLALGCGGSVADGATGADARGVSRALSAAGTDNGNGGWVLTSVTFGPGDFVFPLDCIGETGTFVGKIWLNDHLVSSSTSRGTHDNWEIWWDPQYIVSLTTGQTWSFGPGFNNHGVLWVDESGNLVAQANHEFIPLRNETTGQWIRTELKYRFLVNASGEAKVDFWSFTCSAKP